MKTLSVFVDESGDFGAYEPYCPYYIFSLVFHDQSDSIAEQTSILEDRLFYLNMPRSHCFHSMPIIRREEDYHHLNLQERRKLLGYLLSYFRALPVSYTSISIEKDYDDSVVDLIMQLTKRLSMFISLHASMFAKYDEVIVYYDNGQFELTKILVGVFGSLLPNVQFRKVEPAKYRLFQIADLCCTMDLIEIKDIYGRLSKSELLFFGDKKSLRKNYLKHVRKKHLGGA